MKSAYREHDQTGPGFSQLVWSLLFSFIIGVYSVIVFRNLILLQANNKTTVAQLEECEAGDRRQSHCFVSLSKTLYPLLSTGSNQEDPSQHD